MRRLVALAIVAVIAAIVAVIAATAGGSKQAASATAAKPAAGTVVALRRSSLGSILVDSRGRSLYLFEADKPGISACSASCASIWPPLIARTRARGGAGVTAGKLETIARGGQRQVTYNGHPLYTYVGDAKPGDTTGQGLDQFGAKWYVLNAAGDKIDDD